MQPRRGSPRRRVACPPTISPRLYTGLDVDDSVTSGTSAVSAMRAAAQGEDEWVVIVDLDEFVEFKGPRR